MPTVLKLVLATAVLSLSVACAPPGAPYYHTQNGALAGATAGAVIGHQLDHNNGAVAGGVAGALIGGSIGNQMDYQDQQIYAQQRQIRRMQRQGYYNSSPDYGPPPGYYNRPSY